MAESDLTLASHKLNIIAKGKTCSTEDKVFPPGSASNYSDRGGQSSEYRFYQRGEESRMACQRSGRPKEGQ